MNRAADLGYPDAHHTIANAYFDGRLGVEKDIEKAWYHYRLAAIGGHEASRHNLGVLEYSIGNMSRATKHFMIAARSGNDGSLKEVGTLYKEGYATKDDYANVLRAISTLEMR